MRNDKPMAADRTEGQSIGRDELSATRLTAIIPVPDHDVEVLSEIIGEPVKIGSYLAFVRDQVLSICTAPIFVSDQKETPNEISRIISELNTSRIELWGWTTDVIAVALKNFTPTAFRVDKDVDCLLRITPSRYTPRHNRPNWSQAALRTHDVLAINIGVVGPLAEYCRLMEPLQSKMSQELDRAFTSSFAQHAESPRTTVFSAVSNGKLVGFLASRQLASNYVYLAWSASVRLPKNVSDTLYAFAIEYFVSRDIVFDLGYGRTTTLLAYKMKWEPTDVLPPRRFLSLRRI
jgi:hypothetical protein